MEGWKEGGKLLALDRLTPGRGRGLAADGLPKLPCPLPHRQTGRQVSPSLGRRQAGRLGLGSFGGREGEGEWI